MFTRVQTFYDTKIFDAVVQAASKLELSEMESAVAARVLALLQPSPPSGSTPPSNDPPRPPAMLRGIPLASRADTTLSQQQCASPCLHDPSPARAQCGAPPARAPSRSNMLAGGTSNLVSNEQLTVDNYLDYRIHESVPLRAPLALEGSTIAGVPGSTPRPSGRLRSAFSSDPLHSHHHNVQMPEGHQATPLSPFPATLRSHSLPAGRSTAVGSTRSPVPRELHQDAGPAANLASGYNPDTPAVTTALIPAAPAAPVALSAECAAEHSSAGRVFEDAYPIKRQRISSQSHGSGHVASAAFVQQGGAPPTTLTVDSNRDALTDRDNNSCTFITQEQALNCSDPHI